MFGEITLEEFLRDYWQKKPLLIRNAFPDFESPITPDELAGLACETDTARIVLEKGGKHPWEVRHGAFDEEEFATLPETHWTLLVNDTDQHLPELKAILEPFRFIPDWRIDDLMISFAVEGGSVGPHVDEYDVFLIQAQGQRRWQVTTQPAHKNNFIPDIELKVMRDFSPEQEWVLDKGDMLYLPPNVPHYGVAIDQCMTYSVGFRAPSQADMLEKLMESMLDDDRLKQRFTDPDRTPQTHVGELTTTDLDQLLDFIVDALPQDAQALQSWLGKYLTTPKHELEMECSQIDKPKQVEKLINNKSTFLKQLNSRLMYVNNLENINLYIDGMEYKTSADLLGFVQYLCKNSVLEYKDYQVFTQIGESLDLFTDLVISGVFYPKKR